MIDVLTLETHLWQSANILRGPIDAADFKTFLFPLLFFKRISDVWDEEMSDATAFSGGDETYALFPENHHFQIPEGAHWDDVFKISANIGMALQSAFQSIEMANPETLYGIFGDVNWTNKEQLNNGTLRHLLNHFDILNFGNKNVESDVLGQACEYLIRRFADAHNKKSGEFYTPRSVVQLMVDMLDPQEGETIYDPACGTGGMLLGAVKHVGRNRGHTLFGKLFGQEKNLTTSAIARINLLLHGVEDFHIRRGDTLREPKFFDGDRLSRFDCVISNPPFSLKDWGFESWATDGWGRNALGVPPPGNGDFAWVQHMLASMNPVKGRMAVVVPHGVLFRGGAEGRIRQALLKCGLLEAVIGMAPNLFYGAGLTACILIFRANKFSGRNDRILIADASTLFLRERAQNVLLPEQAAQILGWYRSFVDVEGFARVVPLSEILNRHEGNLNLTRYVERKVGASVPTVDEALEGLRASLAAAAAAEDRLKELLLAADLLTAGTNADVKPQGMEVLRDEYSTKS